MHESANYRFVTRGALIGISVTCYKRLQCTLLSDLEEARLRAWQNIIFSIIFPSIVATKAPSYISFTLWKCKSFLFRFGASSPHVSVEKRLSRVEVFENSVFVNTFLWITSNVCGQKAKTKKETFCADCIPLTYSKCITSHTIRLAAANKITTETVVLHL